MALTKLTWSSRTALIAGNEQVGFDLVKACKDACAAANVLLKVIIETGERSADS